MYDIYGMVNSKVKGGEEKMETQVKAFKEICPYCKKEIVSLYERQVKSQMASHVASCPGNPSIENDKLK